MTSQQLADTLLPIYQANRNDRAICEALLDEFFIGAEYTATLDAVRTAIREPGEIASCVSMSSITSSRLPSSWLEAF